jgi:hypothetical protein
VTSAAHLIEIDLPDHTGRLARPAVRRVLEREQNVLVAAWRLSA